MPYPLDMVTIDFLKELFGESFSRTELGPVRYAIAVSLKAFVVVHMSTVKARFTSLAGEYVI